MKTTVALHATIFDLRTPDRAEEAEDWILKHMGDTSGFRDAFPDARPLTQLLNSGSETIRFAIDPSAVHHGEGWIASVRVIFAREDGSTGEDLKDADFMGTYLFAEDASEAAKKVNVVSVDMNGTVTIGPPNK